MTWPPRPPPPPEAGIRSGPLRRGGRSLLFHENPYDLCILDVMLPKKDGFTLAREIRLSNEDTPFIFLTAKSLEEDTIEGF